MKTFLSNSLTSIFLKCVFLLVILLIVYILIVNSTHWSIIMIILITFIIWFIFLFNTLFGYLKINKNYIFVSSDLAFRKDKIQHKEKINIKDIVAIEFVEEDCTSNGSKISWRYVGTPSYLKIFMNDNSIKRIHLDKYSYKTWIKIEKLIINNNSEILLLKDARTFIKWKRTGIN